MFHGGLDIIKYFVVAFIPNHPDTVTTLAEGKICASLNNLYNEWTERNAHRYHYVRHLKHQSTTWCAPIKGRNCHNEGTDATLESWPQPTPHAANSTLSKPLLTRLVLVGNLSRINRHAKMETFIRTCLCQTRSFIPTTIGSFGVVRMW